NNTATSYGGTVHFTSSDGSATLPGNSTLSNGTGTFSATLQAAGSQTITATDTVNASITGASNTIQVSAAVTHFAVSAPASATAGSAFSITVTALNGANQTVAGYTGTLHFTSSDMGAGVSLPADYTFIASDAGVHTFTNGVTLVTAGSQTITVTDTTASTINGSASVVVNPAAATSFVVAGYPSPVTAGTANSFTVTAKDAFGNRATGYTRTIHFTSSDPKAVLPANYTFTSGDAGMHMFSATLKTATTTGTSQSITATDTVISSISGSQSGIVV